MDTIEPSIFQKFPVTKFNKNLLKMTVRKIWKPEIFEKLLGMMFGYHKSSLEYIIL